MRNAYSIVAVRSLGEKGEVTLEIFEMSMRSSADLKKDRQETVWDFANFVVQNPTKEELSVGLNVNTFHESPR